MLLRQLALNIDPSYVSEQEENNPKSKTSFPKVDATVKWKDETTESRKIVYIPQTYLNRTIDNPEESTAIHNIIANVLLQEPKSKLLMTPLQIQLILFGRKFRRPSTIYFPNKNISPIWKIFSNGTVHQKPM